MRLFKTLLLLAMVASLLCQPRPLPVKADAPPLEYIVEDADFEYVP